MSARAALALLPVLLAAAGCQVEQRPPRAPAAAAPASPAARRSHFLGLRTAIYAAADLPRARAWYAEVLGVAPYFDQPFYVGFTVGGFELGIVPDSSAAAARPRAGVAYWGVTSADSALARLLSLGATPLDPVEDVGGGIRTATVHDPFGNVLGIIENPNFRSAP